MLKHFDHVTVAVTDPAAAIGFFALLGFELDKDVVIKGPVMDQYLGIMQSSIQGWWTFSSGW
jgi:catechol 2,3-dioxygenase-like lactoylglutathione lyase family enzyme